MMWSAGCLVGNGVSAMSAETKAALDAAITAHVTDETGGALVTGWVVQAAGIKGEDMDEGVSYLYREIPDRQPAYVTLGLLDYGHTMFRHAIHTPEGSED